MGSDHQEWYFLPEPSAYSKPVPKKSPIGTSTLGSVAPSQYMRSTSSRKWKGLGELMVNQMCRIEPALLISASVAVDPAFSGTQSALPPERSALEARLETALLRLASPSRGLFCCPRTNVEKHTRKPTTLIMAILRNCDTNLITAPKCYVPLESLRIGDL